MGNKMMLMLIGVAVVVMIMMGSGFFMLWSKVAAMDASAKTKADPQEAEGSANAQLGPIYSLETMIVNLADDGGNRYLRITIDIELDDEKLRAGIDERLPQLKDSLLTILPDKHFADISTVAGKNGLRQEIKTKLNGFFEKPIIQNVYFTEFVVQ
jgi:flagellar FliL protein